MKRLNILCLLLAAVLLLSGCASSVAVPESTTTTTTTEEMLPQLFVGPPPMFIFRNGGIGEYEELRALLELEDNELLKYLERHSHSINGMRTREDVEWFFETFDQALIPVPDDKNFSMNFTIYPKFPDFPFNEHSLVFYSIGFPYGDHYGYYFDYFLDDDLINKRYEEGFYEKAELLVDTKSGERSVQIYSSGMFNEHIGAEILNFIVDGKMLEVVVRKDLVGKAFRDGLDGFEFMTLGEYAALMSKGE